jgi:hypothetical protein
MITKEQIKTEVDNLPESLLETVYMLLVRLRHQTANTMAGWTVRDFHGTLDDTDIRKSAHE